MTQDAYFSLLTHTKQLLLVKFGDKLAGIEVIFGRPEPELEREPEPWTDGWMNRQTWKSK